MNGGILLLKVCRYNKYFYEISKYLNDNSVEYSIEECLGRCDICSSAAFIQNGDYFITGVDADDLIDKIRDVF